jgi:pectin methylesterase-like acyl-CoA thioesterase
MRRFASSTVLVLAIWARCTRTAAENISSRAKCQRASVAQVPTACPPNTIVVGPNGSFKTIQSAVQSVPKSEEGRVILIQPGTYHEQVNVTGSAPLTLLGSTTAPNDHADNKVTVLWKGAAGKGDNAFTSALTIAPTLDSSLTGSGPTGHHVAEGTKFGSIDFRAYNIDFINDFKKESAGPSHAVGISYANAGFYYCGLRSYQDTVS